MKFHLSAIVFCLAALASVEAATLDIQRFTVAGGGGSSSKANFSVTGTIGQKEGNRKLANGRFEVKPGFWRYIGLVQLPGSPELQLQTIGNTTYLRWATAGPDQEIVLEVSSAIGPGANWQPATTPITTSAGQSRVEIVSRSSNQFFRLRTTRN